MPVPESEWPKITTPQPLEPIKHRVFTGCITEPITLDINDPFSLKIDSNHPSILHGKKITKVDLRLKKTGSPLPLPAGWDKIFGTSDTVNVSYRLGDGTTLTM